MMEEKIQRVLERLNEVEYPEGLSTALGALEKTIIHAYIPEGLVGEAAELTARVVHIASNFYVRRTIAFMIEEFDLKAGEEYEKKSDL